MLLADIPEVVVDTVDLIVDDPVLQVTVYIKLCQ